MKNTDALSEEVQSEIHEFEKSLQVFGFKRTEASIYGYLALSEQPQTADEICTALNLSQGAVSQGLKRLAQWGGIDSQYDSTRRAHLHSAVEDSMKIVGKIFKRREQDAILNIKNVAKKALERCTREGDGQFHPRVIRLKSIILTCETAEAVIKFILSMSGISDQKKTSTIVRALPKTFEFLVFGTATANTIASKIKGILGAASGENKQWH